MSDILIVSAPSSFRQLLTQVCELGYPDEVNGFAFGCPDYETLLLQQVFPMQNRCVGEARRRRFEMTTDDWMHAESVANQQKLELVGLYHSHPDHSAIPSSTDLEYALPNLAYLIASVVEGKVGGLRAWILCDDRTQFRECCLRWW